MGKGVVKKKNLKRLNFFFSHFLIVDAHKTERKKKKSQADGKLLYIFFILKI